MAQKYKQLTIEEREKIQLGLLARKSLRTIAKELKRSPSTLSRELRRNHGIDTLNRRHYTPRLAHRRFHSRIVNRGKRHRLKSPFIRSYVHDKLQEGWSPEQISGRLSLDYPKYRISHEAIYQYIYSQYKRGGYGTCTGADLRVLLRRRHKVRHPRKVPYAIEKGALRDRVSIDQRPKEVLKRKKPGHWEGDSLVSKQSLVRLNTLVERVSGLVFVSKLSSGKSSITKQVVVRRLKRIPKRLRRSITFDNGIENAKHKEISKSLRLDCYFAHPYHSWERGINENTNGLIRWYLPKKTDFSKIQTETISFIENQLNNRPRKRLSWKTPLEVFNFFVLH